MDVVVTVPMNFEYDGKRGLAAWISEGDAAGEPWTGEDWHFFLGGYPPKKLQIGERVYVVYNGQLRGYAPLVRIEEDMVAHVDRLQPSPQPHGYALVRQGGAVAVTITETIRGFRGFRYRWWNYEDERPFPDWRTA